MNVGIAYADSEHQIWLKLEMPEGSTVQELIEHSGILQRLPHIEFNQEEVGIFGKLTELDAPLNDGDRVEIYRAITADPATVKRRAVEQNAG